MPVRNVRRGLLVLGAMTFVLGAVLTTAVTLGSTHGSVTSGHAALVLSAPSTPTAQLCSTPEQCMPAAPLNSPAPVPPVLSFGFIAAGVVILADRLWRERSARDAFTPSGIPSAIVRPPIAS
jgi:hypothetical protein